MSYLDLNLLVLGLGFWFFVICTVMITQQMRRKLEPGRGLMWRYVFTLAILLVLTAVFDNVIVGLGIVAYNTAHLSGIYLGLVPIEDFAYSVAAVLVLPTLWGVLSYFDEARAAKRNQGPAIQ